MRLSEDIAYSLSFSNLITYAENFLFFHSYFVKLWVAKIQLIIDKNVKIDFTFSKDRVLCSFLTILFTYFFRELLALTWLLIIRLILQKQLSLQWDLSLLDCHGSRNPPSQVSERPQSCHMYCDHNQPFTGRPLHVSFAFALSSFDLHQAGRIFSTKPKLTTWGLIGQGTAWRCGQR